MASCEAIKSLSTFMRDISRHLGFMGCGLLVVHLGYYYIVQYAVYSPDIFLILHLLFPDFFGISTMRNTTQNQTKILGKNAKEKGDFEEGLF